MNAKRMVAGSAIAIAIATVAPWSPPAAASDAPQITGVTVINGNLDSYFPGVSLAANLDSAPVVVGMTRYDSDGTGPHPVFSETWAPFLWQPMPAGSAVPGGQMKILRIDPPDLYTTPSFYMPAGIADNQTVVGNVFFRDSLATQPWISTATGGVHFLPLPDSTWQGSVAGVSADGNTVAGTVLQRVGFDTITEAARWNVAGKLSVIGEPGSQANAVSRDGRVIVGSTGGHAARWVDGTPAPMDAVANGSNASLVSTDDATVVGTLKVSPAFNELVRWNAAGTAQVFSPPTGYSVARITAANPDASVVVGALVSYPDCTPTDTGPDCPGNQVPFVWNEDRGFTVLPEQGLGDFYDASSAIDVSDDGNIVVGQLSANASHDGDPKPVAFVWTRSSGEILLNTLAKAAGYDNELFGVVAISGSGHRIVANSVARPSVGDTNSVILDITGLS